VTRATTALLFLSASCAFPQNSTPPVSEPCAAIRASLNPDLDEQAEKLNKQAADLKARIAPLNEGAEKDALDKELKDVQGKLLDLVFARECIRSDMTIQVFRGPSDPPTKWIEITTYFATNRQATGSSVPENFFGPERSEDNKNQFGKTVVSIPTARRAGELNLPSLWKLEVGSGQTFRLQAGHTAGYRCRDGRNGEDHRSEHKEVSSCLRARVQRQFRGRRLANRATRARSLVSRYCRVLQLAFARHDARLLARRRNGSTLGRCVRRLSGQHSRSRRIRSVSHRAQHGQPARHSVLRDRAAKGKNIPNLRELLLAAPDVNAEIFREKIIPGLAAIDVHRTIYASSSDVALRASKIVHEYRRVGETTDGVLTFKGFETVDASGVAPILRAFGHSYVVDSTKVLGDIADTLSLHFTADQRSLPKQGTPPDIWWVLK
jgi:Alpha/beta hydrolase of unknown function (DUF900)